MNPEQKESARLAYEHVGQIQEVADIQEGKRAIQARANVMAGWRALKISGLNPQVKTISQNEQGHLVVGQEQGLVLDMLFKSYIYILTPEGIKRAKIQRLDLYRWHKNTDLELEKYPNIEGVALDTIRRYVKEKGRFPESRRLKYKPHQSDRA